jgi:hypothetical protein
MKETTDSKEILENIRWFIKFPLRKRLEIAYKQMKAIKILRGLSLK